MDASSNNNIFAKNNRNFIYDCQRKLLLIPHRFGGVNM